VSISLGLSHTTLTMVYAQHLGDQMRSRLVTAPRWPPDTPPSGTPSSTPSWATSARSPSSSSSPWSCYSHSPPSVTTAIWQTKISGSLYHPRLLRPGLGFWPYLWRSVKWSTKRYQEIWRLLENIWNVVTDVASPTKQRKQEDYLETSSSDCGLGGATLRRGGRGSLYTRAET